MKTLLMAVCAAIMGVVFAEDGVLWVDDANFGKPDLDGRSATTAFGTIQDAVNAAEIEGSGITTIKVLPGTYNRGGKTFSYTYKNDASGSLKGQTRDLPNRVLITKKLTLLATSDDPADTHIVGARDPNPEGNTLGIGPDAVRCVFADAKGVVIKGFTIRDGASQAVTAEGDVSAGYPGSVYGPSDRTCYLVDCVVSNCVGTRCCSARRCTAVRTLFSDNVEMAGNAVGRENDYFHCVVRRCASICMNVNAFNTTFVECPGSVFASGDPNCFAVNTVCAVCGTSAFSVKTAYNNAFQGSVTIQSGGSGADNVDVLMPLFAPLLADYRPLSGSGADTAGSVARLKAAVEARNMPEIVDAYRSMDGVTIDPESTSPIAAGAYQKAAVAAGGAILYANSDMACEGGRTRYANLWAYAETYPSIFSARNVSGNTVVMVSCAPGKDIFPSADGLIEQAFPPAGIVVTNTCKFATKVYYVNPDPEIGKDDKDEEGRGASAEKPFRTLQYAVDRVPSDSLYYLIRAAAGTYAEGGSTTAGGHMARVGISGKRIRIIGAGIGKSFVSGLRDDDPNTCASDGSGRGTQAVRCFAVTGTSYVNVDGFTVTNGYSSCDNSDLTKNGSAYNGGLVYVADESHVTFSGCKFGKGCAYRGSLVSGGRYDRCVFSDCAPLAGGVLRACELNFCRIDGMLDGGVGGVVCDSSSSLYQSTLVAGAGMANPLTLNIPVVNSVVVGTGWKYSSTPGTIVGSVLSNFTTLPTPVPDEVEYVEGDPLFVDRADGDYRVGDISPAVGEAKCVSDWWTRPVTDLDGRRISFRDGLGVAGAYLRPVQTVTVAPAPSYPGAGTDPDAGVNFIEPGESLTVTVKETTNGRPVRGVLVNGEEVKGKSYTVTAPTDETIAPVSVSALYQTDFYVDAAKVANPGDGFTPETAKGTLAAAMTELPLASGDTVHAAAGTYRDGDMEPAFVNSAPSTIHSRVVVPDGVTLVADEGPAATVIEGSSPNGSGNRFSADAIRCASVCAKGILKGFTILGGQTMDNETAGKTVNGGQDDGCGGGVLAASGGTIVGCVITNCCACRGGGASGNGARYVNTEFRGNSASATSSAAFYGEYFGCFFDGNANAGGQVVRYCAGLHNCTVTANNTSGYFQEFIDKRMIANSIMQIRVHIQKGASVTVTNTVYSSFGGTDCGTPIDAGGNVAGVSTAADAGLDAVYRPVKGGLAMDSGDNALVSDLFDGLDLAGVQRIYNGTVDRGCYEYDWRGDYASDLGGNATVVAADPQVVETNLKKVLVRDGALNLCFRDDSLKAKYAIPFVVTGTGKLTLTAGDEVVGTYTAADGAQNLLYRNGTYGNDLAFTYEPGENDDGGALLDAISGGVSGLLLLVR